MDYNWIMENIDGDLTKIYNLMLYTQNKAKELDLRCELYGQIFQVKREVEHTMEENIAGF